MAKSYQDLLAKLSGELIAKYYSEKLRDSTAIGIDRITPELFGKRMAKNVANITSQMDSRTYIFSPFVEKLILKGKDHLPRRISIPTIKDKVVLNFLKEVLQEAFPECVNQELINVQIKKLFKKIQNKEMFVLKADIGTFYDTINQAKLLTKLRTRIVDEELISFVESAIQNPTVPRSYRRQDRDSYRSYTGVPQGLSISNILAEIYLLELDSIIKLRTDSFSRYVDDIVLFAEKKLR